MANRVRVTEHNGAKKGEGAYWGVKKEAKVGAKKRRRQNDRIAISE